MQPYWRKQAPDDGPHSRVVAMVTAPTGMTDVHLIAPHTLSDELESQQKWNSAVAEVLSPTLHFNGKVTFCSNFNSSTGD